MHICLFDLECLIDWWQFGMPLRVYWGDERSGQFWTIPFTGRRGHRMWDEAEIIEAHVIIDDEKR